MTAPETCEYLSTMDGCTSQCQLLPNAICNAAKTSCAICGNGVYSTSAGYSEGCDDEDRDDNDGCSSTCTVEDNSTCVNTLGGLSVC